MGTYRAAPPELEHRIARPAEPEPREVSAARPPAPQSPALAQLMQAGRPGGRGGDSARAALLHDMQQTYGNRAVQRYLQRAASGPAPAVEEDLEPQISRAAGGGNRLPAPVQRGLEGGLGADLSGVRVHTDGEADHLARSVDAEAFTTGSDIFFRSGAYNPGTPAGMHLLAHEATHTVQQAAGPVAGTPHAGGVAISDPGDQFEQAADQTAARVMAGVTPAAGAGGPGPGAAGGRDGGGAPAVQRYQAGGTGHGGIEERALTGAGFTPDEANQVYLGNWMRDFSQLTGHEALIPLFNILALGEFGREITKDELGTYVPSEHLDNPAGSGTAEDPNLSAAEWNAQIAKLSPDQQTAFAQEELAQDAISKAAAESHLPAYIERGKFHAKDKLTTAVARGATPAGRMAMGDALHAVEDYFSHSNFVEAAIWTLDLEGVKVDGLRSLVAQTPLGAGAAAAGGFDPATGQPKIYTGTYHAGANDWVSRAEVVKSEIEHGGFTRAFVIGWLRKNGITGEELGRVVGRSTLGVAAGVPLAGLAAVGGGLTRGVEGAAAGWEQNSGLGALGHAVSGFFSGGASGVAEGAGLGWDAGLNLGGMTGGAIGTGVGLGLGTLEEIVAAVGVASVMAAFPAIAAAMAAFFVLLDKVILDAFADAQTKKSAQEAAAAGLSGPTHSQIAKDAPDNPLFAVSVKLAEHVDQEIGTAMLAAWAAGEGKPPLGEGGPPPSAASVTQLVDKFVSTPTHDGWWRETLIAAESGLPPEQNTPVPGTPAGAGDYPTARRRGKALA